MDSIGAQLWLLSYDVARGAPRAGRTVGYAVAAGMLAELFMRRRLGGSGVCEVVSAEPIGSPAADELLTLVAADRSKPWEDRIKEYGRTAVSRVAAELEDRCRIVRYERRVARVLAVRRHALLDPAGVDRLHGAVTDIIRGGPHAVVEPRLAVVASLAATAGIPVVSGADESAVLAGRAATLGAHGGPVQRSLAAAIRSLDVSAVRLPAWI